MIGLGTGSAELLVSTAVEVPVALQLGARDTSGKFSVDIVPPHIAVLLHVIVGDLICDALVAERCDQPVENGCGVALSDCRPDILSIEVGANPINQVSGPSKTANAVNQAHRMLDFGRPVVNFGMVLVLDPTSLNCRRGDHGPQIIATSLR